MRGTESVEISAWQSKDWEGNDVFSDPVSVPDCHIWPRTSTEDASAGQVIIGGLNVFIPPPTVIDARDRISARGKTYEVAGDPGEYVLGRARGTMVVLKRAGA
jgi:hypothetical protein